MRSAITAPTNERAPLGATLQDWNHFDLVLGLGADLLPVVPDPTARPTGVSKVQVFGKIPSVYAKSGLYADGLHAHGLTKWQTRQITPADIEQWSHDPRLGMCVRTSAVRAIDVDVDDAALAREIRLFIGEGALPRRARTNSHKFLLAFRMRSPLKKRIINTKHGRIELLADGQQFVAAGCHPSGVPYIWAGGLPSEIPTLTLEELERMWALLTERFAVEPSRDPIRATVERTAQVNREYAELVGEYRLLTTIDAETLADLKDALYYQPMRDAADDNSTWSEAGYALLSLRAIGRELFCEWSRHVPNFAEGAPQAWWTAHEQSPTRTDYRHIFTLARQLGWRATANPEDFPIVAQSHVIDAAPVQVHNTIQTSLGEVPEAHSLCTDLANANRLRAHYGGTHLIVVGGKFYAWCGTHWQRDEGEAARCAARLSSIIKVETQAAREKFRSMAEGDEAINKLFSFDQPKRSALYVQLIAIPEKAAIIEAHEKADALAKWQKACEMTNVQNNALVLLRKLLTVSGVMLDSHPHLITCESGTIDLRTGEQRAHSPKDYITHCAPVHYVNGAQAPRFNQFLIEITNEACAQFLQRWFGYCVTGEMREQKLVLHIGPGGNGKSTLMGALKDVLGEYMHTAAPGLLTAAGSDRHPTEIADLAGRRMVVVHESDDGAILRESFMKHATGGDALKARFMYGDFFEFLPTHKLQLSTNHKPVVRGQDFGIWRRLLLVWYAIKFGDQEAIDAGKADRLSDPLLPVTLQAEREGIFSWLVAGARTWYAAGLKPPLSVLHASEVYRSEQDRIAEFVAECCILDPSAWSPFSGGFGGLYPAYVSWSKASGYPAFGINKFSTELERAVPGFKRAEIRKTIDGVSKNMKGCYGLRVNLDGDGGGSVANEIEELL